MKHYPILEVCARIEGHAAQHQMLHEYCRNFDDWQGLLERAELEGMAPLLQKHLLESKADIPTSIRWSLIILNKRHQKQAMVRLQVLEETLQLLYHHNLSPILTKGSALCLILYPDPVLRPMRDMDILFSRDEVDRAQELLGGAGFEQSSAPIPPDHHHLPPLYKTVDDVKVYIELHRGLYPNCPPYYPEVNVEKLLETGRSICIGKIETFVFGHEETLHYLYQHGFRSPLTYETYKLINVADIVGFVEKYSKEIDWQRVKQLYPKLYRALPLMQHISPWNYDRVPESFLSRRNRQRTLQSIPFTGWPQRRMKELEQKVSLSEVLKETFLPSCWWLRVYYGAGYSVWRFMIALFFDHPKNVLWWVHMYSSYVIETDTASISVEKSFTGSLRLFFRSGSNKLCGMTAALRVGWVRLVEAYYGQQGNKNSSCCFEKTTMCSEYNSERRPSFDSNEENPRPMRPSTNRTGEFPRRLIVTASIGRSWNPHGEASARHWAHRIGAEFYVRNKPYVIDGHTYHPWFIKWDILADAVEARQPDEVVWLDDDIVIRADTGWPDYQEWAAFEVAAGRDLGDCIQKNGALEASKITGIPWTCDEGYYNTGLVFRRTPKADEFRELGVLARRIPFNLRPDQAAFAVHLARRVGVRRLPLIWHVRGPSAPDGYLSGYINHFLGGKWDDMNRLGPLWIKVPKIAPGEVAT